MPTVRICRPEIESGRRVLVTSDIHGHPAHLEAVLSMAKYSPEDYLILVGDVTEKGPDSLATLRRVMALCKNPRTFVLSGNVDLWRAQGVLMDSMAADFRQYTLALRGWVGTCLFDEMCAELGIRAESETEFLAARDAVRRHFSAELDFLTNRPDVLDTPGYTFVHGGLPTADLTALQELNAYAVLKFDNFVETAAPFDKWVVAGHMPVPNYDEKVPRFAPVFHRDKRILSIDGGCGIKRDGQLNLLIMPDVFCDADGISYVCFDDLPTVRALDAQAASADSINIRWIDHEIRVLKREGAFAEIEHVRTGHRLRVTADRLLSDTAVRDCTDYRLSVSPGDRLSVVMETDAGLLAKKNGESGWYFGAYCRE